jgi:hypothetical protein
MAEKVRFYSSNLAAQMAEQILDIAVGSRRCATSKQTRMTGGAHSGVARKLHSTPTVGEDFAQNHNNGLLLHKTPHFVVMSCIEHKIGD